MARKYLQEWAVEGKYDASQPYEEVNREATRYLAQLSLEEYQRSRHGVFRLRRKQTKLADVTPYYLAEHNAKIKLSELMVREARAAKRRAHEERLALAARRFGPAGGDRLIEL